MRAVVFAGLVCQALSAPFWSHRYREQLMEAQSAKLESDRRLGEATSEVAKLQGE